MTSLCRTRKAKLAAQQHLADQSFQLQLAAIDQQNKMAEAASANIKNDPHMSAQRAYFCGGITTMLMFNYAVVPMLHAFFKVDIAPLAFSHGASIFAVIMLGFVGIRRRSRWCSPSRVCLESHKSSCPLALDQWAISPKRNHSTQQHTAL